MALFYVQGEPISGVAIALALLASMGGLVFGYDTGQISDILLLDDFRLRFATCSEPGVLETCTFSKVRSGAIVGFFSVGTLFGALLGAPVAEYIGRRRAMMFGALIYAVGIIIQITSTHTWVQYAMGRMIGGFGVGGLSVSVPMYQAETAPAVIRGTLTATYQLFITLGILIAECVTLGTREIDQTGSWRTTVGIGLAWPTVLSLGMVFMPESPRWLSSKGRLPEAREALARVKGISKAEAHEDVAINRAVEDAHAQVIAEKDMSAGWLECFTPRRKTLYRTLLGIALQTFQQLTGANYFFYYGSTIFASVGISDSFITQIILGAVNFTCTFGGLYVMEHFGRRWPLIIGGVWQAIWLFIFASVGTARDPENDQQIGALMVASACLFILGFAMTWAPGVWIIIGETFALRTRAKQSSLATASNWLWNFLLAFFTPFISGAIHYRYGFVFAACNLAGAAIVFFFLYESSDLTLEAVDMMYNDPNCKPWNSHRWVPPGVSSRRQLANNQSSAADLRHEDKAHLDHSPISSGPVSQTTSLHGGAPVTV